jgi:hypothetical protein
MTVGVPVLHNDGRGAGNEPAKMTAQQPRQRIVTAAHGRPADKVDLFSGEKALRSRLSARHPHVARRDGHDGDCGGAAPTHCDHRHGSGWIGRWR